MPRMLNANLRLRRMIRRWRLTFANTSTPGEINEFANWVTPNAQVDRDWADDDRLVWGYSVNQAVTDLNNNPSVAVFAGAHEVHIRQVDFRVEKGNGTHAIGSEVHIFTPDASFNPVAIGPTEFFPALNTPPFPRAHTLPLSSVFGGENVSLYNTTIGGFAIAPFLGPRYIAETDVIFQSILTAFPKTTTILKLSDPPIILSPGSVFALQYLNVVALDEVIFANIFLSERDTP